MGRRGSGDSQSKTEQSMPSISDHSSEKGESTSQLHELAVDDSIVDRKVIEKLLKNSCYKGKILFGLGLIIGLLIFSGFFIQLYK